MNSAAVNREARRSDGGTALEEIRADVACPNCEYNLRGLHGDVVQCPECGTTCDIAVLITRRWTKPWWRAPRFNTLLLPACWVFVSWLGITFVIGAVMAGSVLPAVWTVLIVYLSAIIIWGWLMYRTWQAFTDWRAPVCALLAHLILAGYILGIVGVVGGLFALFLADLGAVLAGSAIAIVCTAIIWSCIRGERFIAGYCIRRYLNHGHC